MTNHWADMSNASLFFIIGANPVENHPASMAHVQAARYDIHYDDDGNPVSYGRKARLIVVDPRKSRTAQQTENSGNDLYVRIRPGTDIAFVNGVLKYILDDMEAAKDGDSSAYSNLAVGSSTLWQNYFKFLNNLSGTLDANGEDAATIRRAFIDDVGAAVTPTAAQLAAVPGFGSNRAWPKYVDARVRVNDTPSVTGESVVFNDSGLPGTWMALKHVGANPGTVVVTGFTEGADYEVDYAGGRVRRIVGSTIGATATISVDYSYLADDYERGTLTVGASTISNMLVFAGDVNPTSGNPTVYQKLRQHLASYDLTTAADICGCQTTQIAAVAKALMDNCRAADSAFGANMLANGVNVRTATYRATTLMYAMGATQHTNGSQNIRAYAILQSMLGNMGRPGGGINALRGIHNVQGSTDMGLLFDLIPGYSGNPGTSTDYATYANALFGNRLKNGTSPVTSGAKDPYNPTNHGLQQRGFYNMTREWFGNTDVTASADFDKLYALWPKGNGYQHIDSFREMISGSIKAAVVWGQNPAVTEPNQSAVRAGLKNLETLVCVDMFPTETVECDRDGVTYFIPACSHVEEAGSVTSSGRWIQWRERGTTPRGNSKADIELILRFAKALNTASAFSHIKTQWAGMSGVASLYASAAGADPFTILWAKYGYDAAGALDAATDVNDPTTYTYKGQDQDGNWLGGSEFLADKVCWEMGRALNRNNDVTNAAGMNDGGTMWIYSGNGNQTLYTTAAGLVNDYPVVTGKPWTVSNRAKSRDNSFAGNASTYPRWAWAWLLNRRVFYNNAEVPNDVGDLIVAPGHMARMFTVNTNTLADWAGALAYRAYNTLKDVPTTQNAVGSPHVAAGRIPGHTEPYESPRDGVDGRANLVAKWGYNTAGGAALLKTDGLSPRGTFADYPLVLTTIRCVEHFQGGPITRNNSWNVEAEPVPWIEINSLDARKYGIADGDWVNVITARSNSTTDQEAHTPGYTGWAEGFKARVGSGTSVSQRVAAGVVAIPWHWGDKGLSKGSRANDLTIDAWDANTTIPEYKACLCKIVKL